MTAKTLAVQSALNDHFNDVSYPYGGEIDVEQITEERAAAFIDTLYESGWEILARKTCTAFIRHGPGHQSKSRCEVRGTDHDVHGAELYGTHVGWHEWTGDEGSAVGAGFP